MSQADTLIAVCTLMLEAASREDWASVATLDQERRTLIEALPATLSVDDAARLRALDQQLLVKATSERTRLGERMRVGQKLDQAARQYALAARSAVGANRGR